MSEHLSFFRRLQGSRRLWALVLPVSVALACLFAFMGLSKSSAQATSPFTNCPTNTGNNALVLIPGTAPQVHTAGYFTPAAGDEFAVFRPIEGTCETLAPGTCAGVKVWQGTGANVSLTVWGDDEMTLETDGMLSNERMCWRVWDASENNVYTATVVYSAIPPNDPSGLYVTGHFYRLNTLTPTAVELLSFNASSSPLWAQKPVLLAGGFLLIGATLVLFRRRRS